MNDTDWEVLQLADLHGPKTSINVLETIDVRLIKSVEMTFSDEIMQHAGAPESNGSNSCQWVNQGSFEQMEGYLLMIKRNTCVMLPFPCVVDLNIANDLDRWILSCITQ